jgi:hypothetical protein
MARVTCTEYRDSYKDSNGTVFPFPAEPPVVTAQAAKTTLSSSTVFTLNSATRWVRLSTDTAIHYLVGKTSPTATTNDTIIPANTAVDIPVGKEGRYIAVLATS